MIISENQIKMDPAKLEGIKNWPSPTTVKQVRSFLGFENFYRKFIGYYADIVRPLNNLTKKDLIWNWMNACEEAFEKLKEEFQKAPVLLMPDLTKPFTIETDASKFATGAVIQQKDMNEDWHPCGYISHSFDVTQRNYEIYDRELMGIVCALETWRHYLQGSPFFSHNYPIRSQKSDIFLNRPKVEQTTSSLELIPIRIRLKTHPHPQIQNNPIRCPLSTTRSHHR